MKPEKIEDNILLEKLEKLEKVMKLHLDEEEEFMQLINYPFINTHRNSHVIFRREIEKISSSFKTQYYNLNFSIKDLASKFFYHIDWEDTQYVKYYKKKKDKLVLE